MNKQNGGGEFKFWKPRDFGEYTVRILPPVDEDGLFFQQFAQYKIGDNYIMAPFIEGLPDPIHDYYKQLWKERTKESIKLAQLLKPRKQYLYNIVVRDEKGVGTDTPTKVYLYSAGQKLHDKVLNYFWDEDFGDLSDVEEGFDFKIVKEDGASGFPNYDNSRPRNKCSPLFDNKEMIEEALAGRYDLKKNIEYKSVEELKNILQNFITNQKNQ